MSEIASKMKQMVVPMALGWILTIWAPVPPQVRGVVGTMVAAVQNGAHAVMTTVTGPQQEQTASR